VKKIVFGITSLTLGGAERVLVDIANELSKKYDITIFTIYSKGELEKQLNKNIKLESIYDCSFLELNRIRKKLVPIKILLLKNRMYKKYINNKYDIEIAFLEGAITRIFSCGKSKKKKIVWIHNDIEKVFGKSLKAILKRHIDKKVYNKFSNLIFVSNDNKKSFEKVYEMYNKKQVIYNYIDRQKVIEKSKEKLSEEFNNNTINFVTVSRLVEQKAIDRLIKIHSRLIKEEFYHKIYVVGDGPLKEKLKEQIIKEKVEETFILLGKKENPYPYIKEADYFCLLSYFEGYPMVLEEAKILNKDILITNTAARETIANYKKGQVLENSEEDIYIGLKNIIKNGKIEEVQNVNKEKEYNNTHIINQIIDLIEK